MKNPLEPINHTGVIPPVSLLVSSVSGELHVNDNSQRPHTMVLRQETGLKLHKVGLYHTYSTNAAGGFEMTVTADFYYRGNLIQTQLFSAFGETGAGLVANMANRTLVFPHYNGVQTGDGEQVLWRIFTGNAWSAPLFYFRGLVDEVRLTYSFLAGRLDALILHAYAGLFSQDESGEVDV